MEGQVEELLKIWQGASENSRELKEGVTKLNKKIKDIQSNKVITCVTSFMNVPQV